MLQVKHVEQDLRCQIEIIDIRFCGYVMIKYGSFESLEVPCQIGHSSLSRQGLFN